MAEMVDLNIRRALASGDCTDWDPVDMLRYTLREIEEGRIDPEGMVVVYFHRPPEGGLTYGRASANIETTEQIALLNVALNDTVVNWGRT